MYESTLTITGDSEKLAAYLKGECRELPRSTITLEQGKGNVKLHITARDAVALRSAFNTIGQALIVWEKL